MSLWRQDNFLIRVVAGAMIFYIHGWHKLEGWIAYLQHGTPWKLAEEVAEMHFPMPLASAVAATLVQFICSLFGIGVHYLRVPINSYTPKRLKYARL